MSNGKGTVLLQVRRQSGTNTVEVVKMVRRRLAEIRAALPPGYDIRVVRDLSEFIEASIHSVEEHLVLGSILAALVVLLFLTNVRSTLIAAIAIPTSIIATFGLVWCMGFTLNSMTMLALTLAVGIVIDDAIVVLENIFRFIEEKNVDPFTAAVRRHQGNRPGRAGDDALARRDLRAGGIHGRHRRTVHGELRPDDGLRHHGVAARQLHADADDGSPLAEARQRTAARHSSKESRIFRVVDAFYTVVCSTGRWRTAPPSPDWPCSCCSPASRSSCSPTRTSCRRTIRRSSKSTLRAPEGTSLESTEVVANRIAGRAARATAGSGLHASSRSAAIRRTRATWRAIYVRLSPLEQRTRDQFQVMDAVASEILPPLAANLRTSVQPVATIGGSGAQNADVQF